MPRATPQQPASTAVATTDANAVSTYVMPDDVRADLLRAQRGMISERQKLPQVKIMPAGANLFEFTDTHETVREFVGVVLGSHLRNVLWDRAFGAGPVNDEDLPTPACVANAGQTGTPRMGFQHQGLGGRAAAGTELIGCRACPYNQWLSKRLIPALFRPGENPETAKGKACNNQRAVYLLMSGRATPIQLILPPTSLTPFDEYLATLLNRGVPVQSVLTTVGQTISTRGRLAWGVASFSVGESLDAESFGRVLSTRRDWQAAIDGIEEVLTVEEASVQQATNTTVVSEADDTPSGEDEDIPF